jgi:hypothetical protein
LLRRCYVYLKGEVEIMLEEGVNVTDVLGGIGGLCIEVGQFIDVREPIGIPASTPSDADTHSEQPNQALLITGKHPTCPACESLVLPTGMCVNGCRNPNESKARADGKDKP